MKARHLHFSARLRQYRHLAKRIEKGIHDGSFRLLSRTRQRRLLRKLKARLLRLTPLFSEKNMKNALAGLSMLMATGAGAQSFAPPVQNAFGLPTADEIAWQTFADLDGDGDQDFFSIQYSYYSDDRVMRFYENAGTPEAPVFAADNFEDSPFGLNLDPETFFSTPNFVDLDNDGDLDLVVGDLEETNFYFFENTGTATEPAFGAIQPNPFGLSPIPTNYYTFPSFVDLDGDGDLDLFATSYYGANFYFENTGTPETPTFIAPVSNPFGISTPIGSAVAVFPDFKDLDGDGDFDLLAAHFNYGVVMQYFENVGTTDAPDFAAPVANPFGLQADDMLIAIPTLVDIDNDGDLDLMATDFSYDSYFSFVTYFENLEVVNQVPPASANTEVFTPEDVPYDFAAGDFPFFDGNISDELQAVQITAPPVVGSLTLNGTPVMVDQIIAVADLPNLAYAPNPDDFGNNYSEFSFKVSDGSLLSNESYLMTINVTGVNDAPVSADNFVDMFSNMDNPLSVMDFPFSDADGDELALLEIVETVGKGNLTLNGTDVANAQTLTAAQVNDLIYTPVPGEEGLDYTSFKFRVSDGTEFEVMEYTMTINIVGPNATGENKLDADVQLSPNPAPQFLRINISSEKPLSNLRYAIFSNYGQRIQAGVFMNYGMEIREDISVAELTGGAYFLTIYAGDKEQTFRFVKN